MTTPYHFPIPTLESLAKWAQGFAPCLRKGDVIALIGPMGAGKTTFTQCLGNALDVKEVITSPTFGLIHEYQGRLKGESTGAPCTIVHVDFYRLEDEGGESIYDELASLHQEKNSLIILEWPRFAPYTESWITWTLTLSPQQESEQRVLTLEGPESRLVSLAHVTIPHKAPSP